MSNKEKKREARLKKATVILAALLALSCVALAGRFAYQKLFPPQPVAVTVPNNVIEKDPAVSTPGPESEDRTEENEGQLSQESAGTVPGGNNETTQPAATPAPQATVIELYQRNPSDNQKFTVENMFPGDWETRYFCVRVYHDGQVELAFRPEVTGQTKSLAKVLQLRVMQVGAQEALCSASFEQAAGREYSQILSATPGKVSELYYRVDVWADTSVGNEYQQGSLDATFTWYVKQDAQGQGAGSVGSLTAAPQTGDPSNLLMWLVLAEASLLLLLILYRKDRKEKKGNG